jgi:DivIVA domain-containing protein
MWLFAILIVLALGGVAVVAAGRGAPMSRAYDDAPDSLVSADGPITADDLRRIRFPIAFRGYRMAEVDALLDRLAEERETGVRRPVAEDGDGAGEPGADEPVAGGASADVDPPDYGTLGGREA